MKTLPLAKAEFRPCPLVKAGESPLTKLDVSSPPTCHTAAPSSRNREVQSEITTCREIRERFNRRKGWAYISAGWTPGCRVDVSHRDDQ